MPHPAVARLGFRNAEAEIADSFIRSLRHRGRTEREAVELLTAYADKFGPNSGVSWSDASLALGIHAERNGLDADLVDACDGWQSILATSGPSAIRPLDRRQDPKAAEARRGEIEQMLRTDSRQYWNSPQIQDEFAQLLQPQDTPLLEGPR